MGRLTEKVAIVTGASKGIGSGIAKALAATGARVAVNYSSDRIGAERVVQAVVDSGRKAIAIGADVSKAVDTAFGRLDVLVNNAGVFRFGAFADITEESFHVHYNVTCWVRFSRCRRPSSALETTRRRSTWLVGFQNP